MDPVARALGYVLTPLVELVGRRVERRVRRALPAPPEPPRWAVPVVVVVAVVGAVAARLVVEGDRGGDPHPAGSESERAEPEPEATAERGTTSGSDEDAVAVEEALERLEVAPPPMPEPEDVRAAYRRRVLETHPDQGGDAERFIAVREAWETVAEGEELSADAQTE